MSRCFFVRFEFKYKWAGRVKTALRGRERTRRVPEDTSIASPLSFSGDWDLAYARVESYLQAHHIGSRVLLNHLASDILATARVMATTHPDEAPVTLAIRIAQARIGEWLVQVLGEGDWTDERFRARGRLALLLSGLLREHPDSFLSVKPLPAETQARMCAAKLQAGPELNLTNMASAPLEFLVSDAFQEKWSTFSRSTFLRASMSWIIVASLAGVAWLATR
jgi:hypothetical protein